MSSEYKRYIPKRRRGGFWVVLTALALSVGVAVGLVAMREYFGYLPDATINKPSSGVLNQEPDASPTPEPTTAPTKPPHVPKPVEESAAVEQSYFDDAVFFGDSITDGIRIYPGMSNAKVIAATGINPDSAQTKEVIALPGQSSRVTMLSALRSSSPGKIYIMMGANWAGSKTGVTLETFLKHYKSLLKIIIDEHTDSTIYLQSMLPVTGSYSTNKSGKNMVGLTNEMIAEYNGEMLKLADSLGINYLDVHSALSDENGELPEAASSDGMHLIPEYYQKWFDYLKTHTASEKSAFDEEDSEGGDESGGESENDRGNSPATEPGGGKIAPESPKK